jgi:hypothetical protein
MAKIIKKAEDEQNSHTYPYDCGVGRGFSSGRMYSHVFEDGTKIGKPQQGEGDGAVNGNTP